MIRTSVTLPNQLYQRALLVSKFKDKTLSELIREALDQVLVMEEEKRLDKVYQALKRIEGIGPKNITNASTTIDETLYGENGAWKPQEE